ncbi:hypothetical protein Sjap_022550 [Stephania japonica]|uniref:GDSL esterase/lipase n=1 Tax=Stephania japonica TaxID=461633 RepID=A0AAP0EUS6_9MAGN
MMRKCGPWRAPLLLHLVLSAAAAAAASPVVPALFILGDSSVNCGDNTFLRFLFRDGGDDPSYSHSCLRPHAHLVPDLLAEKMGLPKIPPFYAGNGTIQGLLSGLNFGSSKATILNTPPANINGTTTTTTSSSIFGFQALNQQLRQAIETFQMLQLQLGLQNARRFIQSSVFYLSLGKDDYINLFFPNHRHHSSSAAAAFARILVNQITQAIKDLYNANARKIICVGIGPLGCAPRSLWEAYDSTTKISGGNYCVKEMNEVILEYNAILSQHLYNLSLELSDAQIIFCDVYQGMMEIITRHALHGFSNVNKACCGFGPYGGMVGCLSKAMSCDAPSAHVWWDFYEPTDAVNSLLADWAWTGQPFDICQPMSIGDVCSPNNRVKDEQGLF